MTTRNLVSNYVNTLRRWLRYLVAVCAAFALGGLAWIGWLLSGQRYQALLTAQLSALFGARVQVESSQLFFQGGLGIHLGSVTVQDDASATPFFVADASSCSLTNVVNRSPCE